MTWYYAGEPFLQSDAEATDAIGFVYQITNLKDGRKYIGQKKLLSRRTKKALKGKKRRRVTVVDSGWQNYWGSNKELQDDVKVLGEKNFLREILYLAPSKAMLNYVELYHQVVTHSILSPSRYYNEYVGGRISRKQLEKFCDGREHKVEFLRNSSTSAGHLLRNQASDAPQSSLQANPGIQINRGKRR